MDGAIGIFLLGTLGIGAVSTMLIIARRNAARARWASEFWLSGK